MSTQENKAVYFRLIEETFNNGNLEVADELVDHNYMEYTPAPSQTPGIAGFKQVVEIFRTAFPDLKVTVEDTIAEGNKVVARQSYTGTHKGELFGIPPTGKHVMVREVQIATFSNGKVVEHREFADEMGLMQQLGVIPTN
jgi:steroid delta-isomerase-like uncharacterized protein